jgi:hypothetical protein
MRRWIAGLGPVSRVCLHEPIIVILLLSGIFTVISGSPVHGGLLLAVAAGLAWDGVRTRYRASASSTTAAAVAAGPALRAESQPPAAPPVPRGQRPLVTVAGVAIAALYAAVAGSFARYSWPATVAVAGLAAAMVVVGWHGPLRPGPAPAKLPRRGAGLWAGLLVAAGLWELAAYLQQPSLTAISHAHPTISALTDPLLVSHPGRSAALAIWLAIGWFLVRR